MSNLSDIKEDVKYIRDKVDKLDDRMDEYHGRLAKVEVRTGFIGFVAGLVSALGIHFGVSK